MNQKEFTLCVYTKNATTVFNTLFEEFGIMSSGILSFIVKEGKEKELEARCEELGLKHGQLKDWCYADEL